MNGLDITLALALLAAGVAYLRLWRRHRRDIAKVTFMFNAIDNGDYSFRFPEDNTLGEEQLLNASLNRVKEILQHARSEQMEREKYFELILDSVDTGILVVEEQRGIVLRCNDL